MRRCDLGSISLSVFLFDNGLTMLKSAVPLFIPGNTFYQPDCLLGEMDNIHSANGNVEPGDNKHGSVAPADGEVQNLNSGSRRLSPPSVAIETPKEKTAKVETTNNVSPPTQPSSSPAPDRPEDQNNNNQRGTSPGHNSVGHASPSPSPPAPPTLPKVGTDCKHTSYGVHTLKLLKLLKYLHGINLMNSASHFLVCFLDDKIMVLR